MNAQWQAKELNGKARMASLLNRMAGVLDYSSFIPAGAKYPAADLGGKADPEVDSNWRGRRVKRLYDACFAFCGLVLLLPLFAVIAALVKLADNGDIIYRQARVGVGGRRFVMFKFRTMVPGAEKAGPSVTKNGDARVTWIGRLLRKTKLDELPQLWNVLKGDMSLVGPRPEVPRYVDHYTPAQRAIFRHKPGITDLATLYFRNEETLLANADSVEEFYIRYCIPRKLRLNQEYAERANCLSDTWIILQTVCPYWMGVLVCHGVILAAAFCLAYELTYNFTPPAPAAAPFWRGLSVTLILQLAFLTWHRQCRGLLSYFSFLEVRKVGVALGLAAFCLLAWSVVGRDGPPVNLILINALLSLCLLGGFRAMLRQWRERSARKYVVAADTPVRVGIIGAGSMGARLALELSDDAKSGRRVVAFFDDDCHKWQKHIHDVPVAGMPDCLLDGWNDKLDEVVIAMPDAPVERVREVEELLRKTSLKFYSFSGLGQFPDRQQAAETIVHP